MNAIEKIRAEIERRISDNTFGAKLELIDLLAWLDQLPTKENPILAPADVQEAADKAAEEWAAAHDTGGFDCYGNAESDVYSLIPAFKAGIDYERERLMKEAPVAEVREVSVGTDAPFYLGLTFREIQRFEFSGKPVRVIIEEIKEVGK